WLKGWVFWTDSNASRALMSNAHQRMIDPYIQVRDKSGRWVTVIPDAGLPSGTNRTMRVDLTDKFLSPDHHVRIVTNLCVYWDRIFFTTDETLLSTSDLQEATLYQGTALAMPHPGASQSVLAPDRRALRADRARESRLGAGSAARLKSCPDTLRRRALASAISCRALPLVSADLHYRGFSEVSSDPNHLRPDFFNYAKLMLGAPWNPARGPYTRYGAVTKLIANTDDHLVAMSTGDEVTVKFTAAKLPPLKPGWKRDFFLYVRGYAKDGEPNTAFARSVDPLPYQSMQGYPPGRRAPSGAAYQQYLRDYETRPGYKLVPPLAPDDASVSAGERAGEPGAIMKPEAR
ncbi:MAG: hypothetical protein ACRD3D_16155, partial [Terriglobia bacterium]